MIHQNNGKVQINGKTYQTVAYRLSAFRTKYPIDSGWNIETECLSFDEEKVTFKATIRNPEGKTVATGHAHEKIGSTFINQTNAYENCETSAVGRVLACAGFIGTEFATAEEVASAIQTQASIAEPQEQSQPKQEVLPKQAEPSQPEAKPESQEAEPNQPKQSAELESKKTGRAEHCEAQSQPEQNEETEQAEQNQEASQPDEERACAMSCIIENRSKIEP